MAEIIKTRKVFQNSATVFWNTTNLLRKGQNMYDLPLIYANEGNINLLNINNC